MMKHLIFECVSMLALILAPQLGAAPAIKPLAKTVTARVELACMDCHGSVPKAPLLGARLGYDESVHKKGGNSRYANGGGCQRCHTNEGFIDFAATGQVDEKAFVNYPSQPGCFTCHAPHEAGTMELRSVKQVTLANGVSFNGGKGNLCATCHMARVDAMKTVSTMTAKTVNANWGAHHSPVADLLSGTNGYQFPEKQYSSAPHASVVPDSCIACHMSQPSARYGFSPMVGGHSFNVVGEVHGNVLANTSGCIACHKDMKQRPGKPVFDILAKADYDQDGKVEPVQEEVSGLLAKFVNKEGTGYLQKLKIPFYKPDGQWSQPPADAVFTPQEFGALYNYKMVLEDQSLGAHNASYSVQLLYDSLQALDSSFNISSRP